MELAYVKEFTVLANTCNYQEAANNLNVSQSTLSRHIQSLERELQNTLFIRTTRTVRLSDFGRFFLPYAQELLCIEHNFYDDYYHARQQFNETILIGAIPAMAPYRFTDVIAGFQLDAPHYRIDIQEITSAEDALDDLRSNRLDFAFLHDALSIPRYIKQIPLLSDELIAILPSDHPLAARETLYQEQLNTEYILTMPPSSIIYKRFIAVCREKHLTPQIRYSGHKEDVVLSLVSNHFGIGILPCRIVKNIRGDNVRLLKLDPPIPMNVSLYHLDNIRMSSGKKQFLEYCLKQMKALNRE